MTTPLTMASRPAPASPAGVKCAGVHVVELADHTYWAVLTKAPGAAWRIAECGTAFDEEAAARIRALVDDAQEVFAHTREAAAWLKLDYTGPGASWSRHVAQRVAEHVAEDLSKPLVARIHSDASLSGWRGAGTGWVVDFVRPAPFHPLADMLALSGFKGTIGAAELTAVACGLRALAFHPQMWRARAQKIEVFTDSREALRSARRIQADPAQARGISGGSRLTDALRLHASTPITFSWVHGHAGDTGNEAADALAGVARRLATHKIDSEQAERFREQIRARYLSDR